MNLWKLEQFSLAFTNVSVKSQRKLNNLSRSLQNDYVIEISVYTHWRRKHVVIYPCNQRFGHIPFRSV